MSQRTLTKTPAREQIVFGRGVRWGDETRGQYAQIGRAGPGEKRYITTDELGVLLREGHIQPHGSHNHAPTNQQLHVRVTEFEQQYDYVHRGELSGYMIGPERADTRISLTGVVLRFTRPPDDELVTAFREFARTADECEQYNGYARAWWD